MFARRKKYGILKKTCFINSFDTQNKARMETIHKTNLLLKLILQQITKERISKKYKLFLCFDFDDNNKKQERK